MWMGYADFMYGDDAVASADCISDGGQGDDVYGRVSEKSMGMSSRGRQRTRDRAQGHGPDTIGIARGERPKVKGAEGSILGLLCEDSDGNIIDAKVFQVKGRIKPDTWYRLEGRVLKETEG